VEIAATAEASIVLIKRTSIFIGESGCRHPHGGNAAKDDR